MCCIVKYGLFVTNLLITVAGLALLGLGIGVLVQLADLLELVPVNLNAIPITLIVLGAFVFLTAFFGCCGAIRENRCFLSLYAIIMLLLAAGMMTIAVIVFRALDNIKDTVVDWLNTAFANTDLREPFHVMEAAFSCCGTAGAGSYVGVLPQLPVTCCPQPDANNTCELANAYGGCNERIGSFFETFIEAIGSVVVVVVGIELAVAVLTIFFCISIGRKK